jgi:AcrR family transcriptional regulator
MRRDLGLGVANLSSSGSRKPGEGSTDKAVARQVIGKRRNTSRVQARGVVRREQLLDAGLELLNSTPVEELTFRQVCLKAKMPEGSAYHFYANKYDLLTAIAGRLSSVFIKEIEAPLPQGRPESWQDLADFLTERGAMVYAGNPAAIQLFLSPRAPAEVKLEDRRNDRNVSAAMRALFEKYFVMPTQGKGHDIFFYFIEITDLIFSLSVSDHGEITSEMVEEAKRAGSGYLATYLPQHIPQRRAQGEEA